MTTTPATDQLGIVLSRIHERWAHEVERILAPAIVPRAGFWDRWSMVRFLTDQFEAFYLLEATLLEMLAPAPTTEDLARLRQGLGEIERTRSRLVGVGRRRGTAVEVSRQAAALLTLVRRWGSEFEGATRQLGQADPGAEIRDTLERLESLAPAQP